MSLTPSLKDLFFDCLRIRRIEEAIAQEYPKQQMRCPVHLSIGQEAVAVGVCSQLEEQDAIMSTHRAHAHYLAKGGSFKRMLAEIHGKKTGCCGGRGGSMHLVDLDVNMWGSTPIVGGSFPIAVGAAFANQYQKSEEIMVIFFGEAMTEEGVFSEGINFASLHQLPILFVCESNFYSVYSPMEVRQPKQRSITKITEAHGIQAVSGNGNDLQEVMSLTQQGLQHIKQKGQPFLIELETYRFREHCGPHYDINLGYRSQQELDQWLKKCPIETLKSQLLEEGQLNESDLEQMEQSIQKEIEEAFTFARESQYPQELELTQHTYA